MRRIAIGALIGAAAVACSGGSSSSNNGGGTFTTSIANDRPLGGLSASESATLCMDVGRYFSDSATKQALCKVVSFTAVAFTAIDPSSTDATIQAACTQAYNACLSGSDSSADAGADSCSAGSTCTATVAELSACLKDDKAALVQTAAAFPSCSSITKASLDADGGTTGTSTPPASCQTFMAKCPDSTIVPATGG